MILLPIEIINYILEYNPNHRDKFKKSLDFIKIKCSINRIDYIYNMWKNDVWFTSLLNEENASFNSYLYNNIDDPQNIINNISKCKCCFRHTILRPTRLKCGEYITFSRGAAPRLKEELNCMCRCRYYCREIHNTFS